ncbi:hypothetical protein MKC43_17420 [[Clostridium] innocuum]|nr:hypothetical protein [[Clostridium] innocuum]
MTNKELSTKIRKTLKESGYTSKDIKVSVRSSLYDTVAKITIHNPHINKNEIEKLLLTAYEEIDRDIVTGEILQGGNTMLFIDYEYGIFEEVAYEWAATAKGLMHSKEEVTRSLMVCICWIRTAPEYSQSDSRTKKLLAHIRYITFLISANSFTNS